MGREVFAWSTVASFSALLYFGLNDAFIIVIATMAVFSIALGARVWRVLLGNRVSVFLGDISYSVYMLQIPVGVTVLKYWPDYFGAEETWPLGAAGFFTAVGVLLAVSTCTYKFIETPLRKLVASKNKSQRKSNPLSAAA